MNYLSKQKEKEKLKKLYAETKNSYGAGCWFNEEKNRYIRYSPSDGGSKMPKLLRRFSNKRVRKSKEVLKRGSYRKLFDYSWELF